MRVILGHLAHGNTPDAIVKEFPTVTEEDVRAVIAFAVASAPGTHAGLFIVRLPDAEQWRLADYLAAWFASPDVSTCHGCLIVATPTKLRVQRPST